MSDYKMLIYKTETEDGLVWNVEYPEVFGCGGAGKTVEDAMADAEINLAMHLEFLAEDGIEKPIPDEDKYSYSGKFLLRLAKTLHQRASVCAIKENTSLNTLINVALSNYLGLESYRYKLDEKVNELFKIAFMNLQYNKLTNQVLDTWQKMGLKLGYNWR